MCVCSALVYLFDSAFIDVHTIEQCPAGNVNKLIEYRFVLSDCHLASTCTRTRWPLKIEPIESNQATLFIYEKNYIAEYCWFVLHFELYALSSPFFLIWYRFFFVQSLRVFCADETSLNISACCSCAKGEQRINAFNISLFLNSFFVFLSLILHFFSILFFWCCAFHIQLCVQINSQPLCACV